MVALPKPHPLQWRIPAPLWPLVSTNEPGRFGEPQVLRFASDSFMDDLKATLAEEPGALDQLVLQHETWERPESGWQSLADRRKAVPRLYQPAHDRFYLVTASLVCRIPGLPDHSIQRRKGERISFVLRRLVKRKAAAKINPYDPNTYVEYAWVPGPVKVPTKGKLKPLPGGRGTFQPTKPSAKPKPDGASWVPVTTGLGPGEEQLSLFPMPFQGELHPRTLWAGFVPVTARETYQEAAENSPMVQPGGEGEADPRPDQFETRVTMALSGLAESEARRKVLEAKLTAAHDPQKTQKLQIVTDEQREVTAFLLLDWVDWLHTWLDPVWQAIKAGSDASLTTQAQKELYKYLQETIVAPGKSLAAWLKEADAARPQILQGDLTGLTWNLAGVALNLSLLTTRHMNALASWSSLPDSAKQVLVEPTLPKYAPGDYYIIRFSFEREGCPFQPLVLSEASQPFSLATFFEPEAPARSVRIVMPTDTSIAGLRKYKKSVSFVVSDKLRQQIERFRGAKLEDLPGTIADAQPFDLGKICSFSIPIITICAMILLFIIVFLLNFVFWWVPFLKICFPIRIKAREG